jgi:D-glycero-alpha-D-manno-heptose-7-phosphate kinase
MKTLNPAAYFLPQSHSALRKALRDEPVTASAPCRVDMGGTLDISTFSLPLRHLRPCTVNIALDQRTTVSVQPYRQGRIKITSRGFEGAEFAIEQAPFAHPLGLMFAIATFFNLDGVHIDIVSTSPPRSALGGSSSAAVALVAAVADLYTRLGGDPLKRSQIALLAQAIEGSVAGVPCGLQDQLAAAYGGVNAWYWLPTALGASFQPLSLCGSQQIEQLKQHIIVAYGGKPHASIAINSIWVRQFLEGQHRRKWGQIAALTDQFAHALKGSEFDAAAALMNDEMVLRCQMTPDVLTPLGRELVDAAVAHSCGARFTGAGGGGCIWAIGDAEKLDSLAQTWEVALSKVPQASMLPVGIDTRGVTIHTPNGTI